MSVPTGVAAAIALYETWLSGVGPLPAGLPNQGTVFAGFGGASGPGTPISVEAQQIIYNLAWGIVNTTFSPTGIVQPTQTPWPEILLLMGG